jgi:hypothetical protein
MTSVRRAFIVRCYYQAVLWIFSRGGAKTQRSRHATLPIMATKEAICTKALRFAQHDPSSFFSQSRSAHATLPVMETKEAFCTATRTHTSTNDVMLR